MSADVLIAGGGLAGASAAMALARGGKHVVLLEKTRAAHHKVCGDFLSHEALLYLRSSGVDVQALGAVSIHTVRLVTSRFMQQARLPFPASSLTRCALDEALLARASHAGADVRRGCVIDGIVREHTGWRAHIRGGDTLHASEAILASGKHDVRGLPRGSGMQRGLVGFKMYFRLSAAQATALGNAVELVLFPGGYAGLQPVEHGAANLCLVITADRLRACGGAWDGVLHHLRATSPHLCDRLRDASALLDSALAISAIPYGYVCTRSPDALWRVGDQAAVIPSFCGDGMAIALHSGAVAAAAMLTGISAQQYQRALANHLQGRVRMATRISQMLVNVPLAVEPVRWAPFILRAVASATRIPSARLRTAIE